jgi:hypothetical protein
LKRKRIVEADGDSDWREQQSGLQRVEFLNGEGVLIQNEEIERPKLSNECAFDEGEIGRVKMNYGGHHVNYRILSVQNSDDLIAGKMSQRLIVQTTFKCT